MLALLDGRLEVLPAVLLLVEGRLVLTEGRLLVEELLLVEGRLVLIVGRLLVEGRLLLTEELLEGLLTLPLALGREVLPLTVGRDAAPLKELLLGTLALAPPITLLVFRFPPLFCGGVIIEVAELLPWRTLAT